MASSSKSGFGHYFEKINPLKKREPEVSVNVPKLNQNQVQSMHKQLRELNTDMREFVGAMASEATKRMIHAHVDAKAISKIVCTSASISQVAKGVRGSKCTIHIESGMENQTLKDDNATQEIVVKHTPEEYYRRKVAKLDKNGELEYTNSDICSIQADLTSHLARTTSAVAAVAFCDAARASFADSLIAMGMFSLSNRTSTVTFYPGLNLPVDLFQPERYLNRIVAKIIFSDNVLGNGSDLLSLSTTSVVRHNRVAAGLLADPLPMEMIERKFPMLAQAVQNFEVQDVDLLPPAVLTRSFSHRLPEKSKIQLSEDGNAELKPIQLRPRTSCDMSGMTYKSGHNRFQHSIGSTPRPMITAPLEPCGKCTLGCCNEHSSSGGCPACAAGLCTIHPRVEVPLRRTCIHGRIDCGCGEYAFQAGFTAAQDDVLYAEVSYVPKVKHPEQWLNARSHDVRFPANTIAGAVVHTFPIDDTLAGMTPDGAYLRYMVWLKMELRAEITISSTLGISCLMKILYDPQGDYADEPLVGRAWMLPGEVFNPCVTEFVSFDVPLMTLNGYVNLNAHPGCVRIVVLDPMNGWTEDFAVDISFFYRIHEALPTVGASPIHSIPDNPPHRSIPFLPLGHVHWRGEVSSSLTKGKDYIFLLNPMLPTEDTKWLPSVSSTVLERAISWRGVLKMEIIWSLPKMTGGTFLITVPPASLATYDVSYLKMYGDKSFNLLTTKRVVVDIPYYSYAGVSYLGDGDIFRTHEADANLHGLRLAVCMLSPLYFPGEEKTGTLTVRYLGIRNFVCSGSAIRYARTTADDLPSSKEVVSTSRSALTTAALQITGAGGATETSESSEEVKVPQHTYFTGAYPSLLPNEKYRVIYITSSPADAVLRFPIHPRCLGPTKTLVGATYVVDTNNALSHRAMESALWRGTLTYELVVTRAHKTNTRATFWTGIAPPFQYAVPDFTTSTSPVLYTSSQATHFEDSCVIAAKGEEINVFKYSKFGRSPLHIHGWLMVKMPKISFADAGIASLQIFVKENLEFSFPVPPPAIDKGKVGPQRLVESNHLTG